MDFYSSVSEYVFVSKLFSPVSAIINTQFHMHNNIWEISLQAIDWLIGFWYKLDYNAFEMVCMLITCFNVLFPD